MRKTLRLLKRAATAKLLSNSASPQQAPGPEAAAAAVEPLATAAPPAAEPPAPTPPPIPANAWHICGDAVQGLGHRRKGLPCQDAVAWHRAPQPILALSDGAGSAAVSERGAQALVSGMTRFLHSLQDDLALWLDADCSLEQAQAQSGRWSERLRLHAQGLLADLAQAERRPVLDLRATLLLLVLGQRHAYWWRVGDGAIVAQSAAGLQTLGHQAPTVAEFANQTCFVDIACANDVLAGVLPTAGLYGVALMSDGGAEKLVARDGSRVAKRLADWLDEVAQGRFALERIALSFHEPGMWERTTLDDRALVLAARPKN